MISGTSIESTATAFMHPLVNPQQAREIFKRNLNLVDGKVRVIEVTSEQELANFIHLPHEIYKNDPIWPGQDDYEERVFFDPARNPYQSYMEIKPFIAVRDGQVVGRIAAIVNEHYNQHNNENIGFFGFFECIDDQKVANELFNTVEAFFAELGKVNVYGPISPTYQDVVGLLIDSFEKVPVKGLSYNPPYYIQLIENYGFYKVKDLLQPSVETEHLFEKMEQKMHKLAPFIEDQNIIARYFDWENIERDAEIVRELFYQTFTDHWGYYPAEPEEWRKMLENYKEDVPEELFLILEDAGEPIAFALCFEDRNQYMYAEKHGQRVTKKRQKWDLVGIKPDYHRNGLGTFIVYNLLPGLKSNQVDELCGSWVLEDNYNSQGLCKSVGMTFHTTYRVYQKAL